MYEMCDFVYEVVLLIIKWKKDTGNMRNKGF